MMSTTIPLGFQAYVTRSTADTFSEEKQPEQSFIQQHWDTKNTKNA